MKKKYVLLLVLGCLIIFFTVSNQSESGEIEIPVPHEKLPFTTDNYIYAITPTYARPVQKAELTR